MQQPVTNVVAYTLSYNTGYYSIWMPKGSIVLSCQGDSTHTYMSIYFKCPVDTIAHPSVEYKFYVTCTGYTFPVTEELFAYLGTVECNFIAYHIFRVVEQKVMPPINLP